MNNSKFQHILSGKFVALTTQEFPNFFAYSSARNISLYTYIQIAKKYYQTDPLFSIEFLKFIVLNLIPKISSNIIQNQNFKIDIYNILAAWHLSKGIKGTRQEKERHLIQTRKYLNASADVTKFSGQIYLILRAFIYFYQGKFHQSIKYFNQSIQWYSQNQEESIIGLLGLAQVYFAKGNYITALQKYKSALMLNSRLPAKARLGMAYCFLKLEKYQLAKLCFKRIISLQPTCIQAQIGYATLQYYEGIKSNYFRILQQCYKINKNHPLTLLHLCQHFLFTKNYDKVLVLAERGVNEIINLSFFVNQNQKYRNDKIQFHCKFYYLLGIVCQQKKNFIKAIDFYKICLNPRFLFININLAQCYLNVSFFNITQAARLSDQVLKKIPQKLRKLINNDLKLFAYIKSKIQTREINYQAINLYNQAIKYNCNDYQSLIQNGNILLDHDLRKCQQLYETARLIMSRLNIMINPQIFNNIGAIKIYNKSYKQAQYYFSLGLRHIDIWKKQSKQQQKIKIIKQKSLLLTFNFNLGILYEEMCSFQQALIHYNHLKQINPLYLDHYSRLACLQFKRGNFKQAENICQLAINIIQKNRLRHLRKQDFILLKSYFYRERKQEIQAKQLLKGILQKDTYTQIYDQTLRYAIDIKKSQSNTYSKKDMLKQKIQICVKSCEYDVKNFYAYMLLGVLLAQLNRNKYAEQCFHMLKEFDQKHEKILYNLGVFYFKNQNYDEALTNIKKYSQRFNKNFQNQFLLAVVLFLQSKYQQALQTLKKIILSNPANILLRFNLCIFLQRWSQENVEKSIKQILKTQKSINYLTRILKHYSKFSKIIASEYLTCIESNEIKQKQKYLIHTIKEKSNDQIIYIKSRQAKYDTYLHQAQLNQKNQKQNQQKLASKMKQINQLKDLQRNQQQMRINIQIQRRRKIVENKLRIQVQLNEQLRNQFYKKELHSNRRKKRQKNKSNLNLISDDKVSDQKLIILPLPERNLKILEKIKKAASMQIQTSSKDLNTQQKDEHDDDL